jgi:hypothetical protein
MPNFVIHNWNDIASDFRGSGLILGNGASIAVSNNFNYPSIFDKAKEEGYINEPLERIFNDLQTKDFEFILRELWHSKRINRALNLGLENKIIEAYNNVRDALINTVSFIHENVTYDSVKQILKKGSEFLSQFNKVFSLNYDLLVYWAIMVGNDNYPYKFKDGFTYGGRFNWESAINPGHSTIVFYPHGNLVIGRHIEGGDVKICTTRQQRRNLLNTITDKWRNENIVPVFVSEGNKEQKIKTISYSPYLSPVYDYFLPNIGEKVVIYGWSMRERDDHIIEAICKKHPIKFAISLYTDNPEHTETCERIKNRLRRNLGSQIQLYFFDAQSEGCWIY